MFEVSLRNRGGWLLCGLEVASISMYFDIMVLWRIAQMNS